MTDKQVIQNFIDLLLDAFTDPRGCPFLDEPMTRDEVILNALFRLAKSLMIDKEPGAYEIIQKHYQDREVSVLPYLFKIICDQQHEMNET